MIVTTDEEAMLLPHEVAGRSEGWPLTDSDARSIAGMFASGTVLGIPFLDLSARRIVDAGELRSAIVGTLRALRDAEGIRDLCDLWAWSVHTQHEQGGSGA